MGIMNDVFGNKCGPRCSFKSACETSKGDLVDAVVDELGLLIAKDPHQFKYLLRRVEDANKKADEARCEIATLRKLQNAMNDNHIRCRLLPSPITEYESRVHLLEQKMHKMERSITSFDTCLNAVVRRQESLLQRIKSIEENFEKLEKANSVTINIINKKDEDVEIVKEK